MKLLIITILLLIPSTVFGATTGISQSQFDVNGSVGQVVTKELWVTNTDTMEQTYEFKMDNPSFAQNISITPKKFRLSQEESKNVVIRFRLPKEKQKTYVSLIAFDSNQASQLKVGNGIKIPVEFIPSKVLGASAIRGNQYTNWRHIAIWLLDAIVIMIIAWHLTRRKFEYSHGKNYKISFI